MTQRVNKRKKRVNRGATEVAENREKGLTVKRTGRYSKDKGG